MAEKWYYSREGQQRGPLTPSQIKELVAAGKLTPTDLIWKEGLESWIPASRLKGLFSQETLAESGAQESQLAVNTGASTRATGRKPSGDLSLALGLLLSTIGTCCQRLFALIFVTLTWYYSVLISSIVVVAVPLVPVFTIGYVIIVCQLIDRKPFSLKKFLAFFEHGWNSLFHLLVIWACSLLIIAITITCTSCLALFCYVLAMSSMAQFGQSMFMLIIICVIIGLIGIWVSAMPHAAHILLFCLYVRVAQTVPDEANPSRFIPAIFDDCMEILFKKWRFLLICGVLLTLFFIGVVGLFFILGFAIISSDMSLDIKSLPLLLFSTVTTIGFVLSFTYAMVFYIRCARQLSKSLSGSQENRLPAQSDNE